MYVYKVWKSPVRGVETNEANTKQKLNKAAAILFPVYVDTVKRSFLTVSNREKDLWKQLPTYKVHKARDWPSNRGFWISAVPIQTQRTSWEVEPLITAAAPPPSLEELTSSSSTQTVTRTITSGAGFPSLQAQISLQTDGVKLECEQRR